MVHEVAINYLRGSRNFRVWWEDCVSVIFGFGCDAEDRVFPSAQADVHLLHSDVFCLLQMVLTGLTYSKCYLSLNSGSSHAEQQMGIKNIGNISNEALTVWGSNLQTQTGSFLLTSSRVCIESGTADPAQKVSVYASSVSEHFNC